MNHNTPEARITQCWNCGLSYHMDAENCSACNAVNANRDLERAERETAVKQATLMERLGAVDDSLQARGHYVYSRDLRQAMGVMQDMLEALQRVERCVRGYTDSAKRECDLDAIRAAIAAATGAAS